MTDWIFQGLQQRGYGAVIADPPWSFRTYSNPGTTPHRTADEPYPVLSLEKLARLPVQQLARPDCALFLWVVDPLLPEGIEIGRKWGFKYKTRAFEWAKTKQDGSGYAIGMGYWTRKEGESCLLFTRGKPARLSKSVRQFIEEPRRAHSQKPDETYRRVEQLVAGPYCELFARQRWPGWDGWGMDYPLDLEARVRSMTAAITR